MKKLKTALAFMEILAGIISAAFGFYFLLDVSNCNPSAVYCAPLGMLAVLVLLFPGCVVATAGVVSYLNKRFSLWAIQSTMTGILILYFGSLFILAWVFASS